MDGGFPYGDIIVIGAIAAFILLRYRAMLGEQRGRDEGGPIKPAAQPLNPLERVVQLAPNRANAAQEKKPEEKPFAAHGALADTFIAMRNIDREFTPEEFLNGAKMAYEMVLGAYSKQNRDTLKMLLSEPLYASFDKTLSDNAASNRIVDTTLVAIRDAKMSKAILEGSKATITVEFVSQQIHLIRDDKGAILEGDASSENTVEDQWVFTRDLRASSPNWVIIDT